MLLGLFGWLVFGSMVVTASKEPPKVVVLGQHFS